MTTATTYEIGQTYHLPPAELLLERNIREAQPSPQLIESIRDVGVLQPISAVVTDEGRLLVRLGHRRTLGAIEAERPTVPVYVAGTDDTTDAAEIDRIVEQFDENTQRDGLTAGDRVQAYEQLAAFGLDAGTMAKRTHTDEATAATALAVAGSKIARKSAAKYSELTLDQAAVVAEFESDPNAVKQLVVAAVKQPHQFAHVAQQHRDEHERRRQALALYDELETAGIPVLQDAPDAYDRKVARIERLRTAKDKTLTEAGHRKCPGRVAWLALEWVHIDDDTAPGGRRQVQRYVVRHGCRDFTKHGHIDNLNRNAGSSSKTPTAELPAAEREKARQQRQLVIDNNKAWDSATTVRREWLAQLAQRKTAPKGTGAFLALAVIQDLDILTDYRATTVAAEITSHPGGALGAHLARQAEKATEGRALLLGLIRALSGYEAVSDRNAWRLNGKNSSTGRYLRFLESCGYGLSDVEKYAISTKTALG